MANQFPGLSEIYDHQPPPPPSETSTAHRSCESPSLPCHDDDLCRIDILGRVIASPELSERYPIGLQECKRRLSSESSESCYTPRGAITPGNWITGVADSTALFKVDRRMAKRKTQSDTEDNSEIALEAALAELGQIVSRLESGQETLDESLAQFERGMTLLRVCHRKLDAAGQRIELVTQISADGEVTTEPFDATSTLQRSNSADAARSAKKSAKADSDDDDDGGLLF